MSCVRFLVLYRLCLLSCPTAESDVHEWLGGCGKCQAVEHCSTVVPCSCAAAGQLPDISLTPICDHKLRCQHVAPRLIQGQQDAQGGILSNIPLLSCIAGCCCWLTPAVTCEEAYTCSFGRCLPSPCASASIHHPVTA